MVENRWSANRPPLMHFASIIKISTSYSGLQYSFTSFTRSWNSLVVLLGGAWSRNLCLVLSKASISCSSVHVTSKDFASFGATFICCEDACSRSAQVAFTKSKITPKLSEYVWVWPKLANIFLKWHLQQRMKYGILIISPSITHFYAECCGEGMKGKKE